MQTFAVKSKNLNEGLDKTLDEDLDKKTYFVRSAADKPVAGLLSANSVEIERFLSFAPQVPLIMYPKVDASGVMSMFWA